MEAVRNRSIFVVITFSVGLCAIAVVSSFYEECLFFPRTSQGEVV